MYKRHVSRKYFSNVEQCRFGAKPKYLGALKVGNKIDVFIVEIV